MKHEAMTILGAVAGLAMVFSAARAGPATTQSSDGAVGGSIQGTVTAEGDVPLSEMVVFLESPDPNRSMPPVPTAVKVSQKGAQFAPKMVVVTVGQAVEFPNDEDRPIEHNVFSNSTAKRFDLGVYGPGQSKTIVFDKPGPVVLYCSIHREMDGVVYVSPTPYTSRVENNGHYQIDNVPPGEWVVKTWQRRRRFAEKSIPITVETGQSKTVDLELTRR